jgi:hypothetical protein
MGGGGGGAVVGARLFSPTQAQASCSFRGGASGCRLASSDLLVITDIRDMGLMDIIEMAS